MKLIAFGDSFVEGLIKEPQENSIEERNKINFVTQLTSLDNKFDSFENHGERGLGNEAIAYKVYKRIEKEKTNNSQNVVHNCFFLVCWSGPYRESNYDKINDKYFNPGKMNFNKNYEFQTNVLMHGISKILELNNIPYAFTSSFTTFNYHNINYINSKFKSNSLFDIIALRYCNEISNFASEHTEFNVEPNQYIAGCNHPTKEGHKLIAKTLDKQLKEYTIIV